MIVSHKYKFIFIKTAKTAGTSTEIALSRICGPDDIITPFMISEDEELRMSMGGRASSALPAQAEGPQRQRLDPMGLDPQTKTIAHEPFFRPRDQGTCRNAGVGYLLQVLL